MRVIAGTARSLPLKTIEGTDTRPTQDRIKETLFNTWMPLFRSLFWKRCDRNRGIKPWCSQSSTC